MKLFSVQKNIFKKSAEKGFTLIELLVVIGILGILAAALVATIDPFEQLKKAQDSNVKNATVEFLNGNVRYYTTHNTFPWDDSANGGANCNGTPVGGPTVVPDGSVALNAAPISDCVTALVNEKELKAGFSNATDLIKEVYVTYDAPTNVLNGCFTPQSTSQKKDKNTIYKIVAGAVVAQATNTCLGNGGVDATCMWCTN